MNNDIKDLRQGEYLLIACNGDETLVEAKSSVNKINRDIGADCFDSVTLSRDPMIVMLVDDTGMVNGRPLNPKATALYHSVCRAGTIHAIHGDVAIVRDEDFA